MRALLTLLVIANAAPAQTREITRPPGIVQIEIDAPAGADVSWEARDPIDLSYDVLLVSKSLETVSFDTFDLDDSGALSPDEFAEAVAVIGSANSAFLFNAEANTRYVVMSDVIECSSGGIVRQKTTWIVTVGEPIDPIDPVVPPDLTGFAKVVYDEALKVGNKAEAATLANNFQAVASQIAAGGITTIDQAADKIVALNAPLKPSGRWTAWGKVVATEMNKANTLDDVERTFNAVEKGLEAL